MKIHLRDRNQALIDAWHEVFDGYDDVHISRGDIFQQGPHLDVQAIVSPANSFGFMDGGIDYVYSDYFGWGIGDLLRETIWTKFNGELLVGQAAIIDMRETAPKGQHQAERVNQIPYLISAPTMRVPMNVSQTPNAYLAFLAALRAADNHQITSLLCPGLGTAIGSMPSRVCAVQMLEAFKRRKEPAFYDVLGAAHKAHYALLNADTYLGAFN